MTLLAGAFVLAAAFVTATVSGVLGMAGGLLLMGCLLLVLPTSTAFVVHGLLQLVSNGWRAFLQRRHVRRAIVGLYAVGAVAAALAVAAGVVVTAVNLVAGVAGPLLDVFFVRTALGRYEVVATKAATQVLSHAAKVVVYGGLAATGRVPWLVVLLAVPLSMLGTAVGGRLLERMSDEGFRSATKYVVSALGVVYLVQAARLA